MGNEAQARIKINKLLETSGWRFFDDENGKANILVENKVVLKKDLDALGDDFEKTKNGRIDYTLLDENSNPVALIEAKKESFSPLDAKEQARKYAKGKGVDVVILSNGNKHYYWNIKKRNENPEEIFSFPSQKDILDKISVERIDPETLIRSLADEKIKKDFIQGKTLYDHQVRAIEAVQDAVKKGNDKFLLEMATGSGKTCVCACLIKLFLTTGNARRVLFLVDRLELERQAQKDLTGYFKNDRTVGVYKKVKDSWRDYDILISTIQSFSNDNKYRDFAPNTFDLVISDEAHRSLGIKNRLVIEHFVGGYRLGLTATPKDYLKNVDVKKLRAEDPRALEKRFEKDTYKMFGCESGEATFKYSLEEGEKDGILAQTKLVDIRTEITTDLLSKEGYTVKDIDEDGEEIEKIFKKKHYEKKFYSDKTNRTFCEQILKHSEKDPIAGEVGKTLVFCVSQKHASKITEILNELAHKKYPDKYNSDFAIQITSSVTDAQNHSSDFSNNKLLGKTRFEEDYPSSRVRVCSTVAMLTAGYDCPDILNVVLLRPIFSPSQYVQIKGRGTRKCVFKHEDKENNLIEKKKEHFRLIDFFANWEYFEKEYPYKEPLKVDLDHETGEGFSESGLNKVSDSEKSYESHLPDPVKKVNTKDLIRQRVDVEFFSPLKKDQKLKEIFQNQEITEAERYVKKKYFDKPDLYITLEKLQKYIIEDIKETDRSVGLSEIIRKTLGEIKRYKTKDEHVEEHCDDFLRLNDIKSKDYSPLRRLFFHFMKDEKLRKIIKSKKYADLRADSNLDFETVKLMLPHIEKIKEYYKDNFKWN